jgi:hypothetical protein
MPRTVSSRRAAIIVLLAALALEAAAISYLQWRDAPVGICDRARWSGKIVGDVQSEWPPQIDPARVDDIAPDLLYREGTLHPLSASIRARQLLRAGRTEEAEALGRLLTAASVDDLVPYLFDFEWGGGRMTAPWYSALAQGDAVILFTRLWEATGEREWYDAAARTASTLRPGSPVARNDSAGFLWFDEYPVEPPSGVINGHIGALLGLYTWWDETGREAAHLRSALSTAIRYGHEFLTNGGTLWYDERHTQRVDQVAYRDAYVWQFDTLAAITGEQCLASLARAFAGGSIPSGTP